MSPESTEAALGRLILRKLEERPREDERSVQWLSGRMGVTAQAAYKWIRTGRIGRANAADLAKLLELDDDEVREVLGLEPARKRASARPMLDPDEFCIVPFHSQTRTKLGDGYENDARAAPSTVGLSFRLESLRRQRIDPECCFVLLGDGDSMRPTLRSNDAMMVDEAQRNLIEGQVYCFERPGGALLVKRYGYDDNGRPALLSENPDPQYRPIPLTPDIKVLGRVVWRSGWI